jgi:Sec-independent protein translocase protein TatA
MTDLVVALFVAILVFAALHVPGWGDALGRFVRRDRPARGDGAAPEERSRR